MMEENKVVNSLFAIDERTIRELQAKCEKLEKENAELQKRVEELEYQKIGREEDVRWQIQNRFEMKQELSELRKENVELRKCHDAELGVCQEHCEEYQSLRALLKDISSEFSKEFDQHCGCDECIKQEKRRTELILKIREAVR